jgi:uncharacterized protein Usg
MFFVNVRCHDRLELVVPCMNQIDSSDDEATGPGCKAEVAGERPRWLDTNGGRHVMVSEDFRRQLDGYGLTTAQIIYRRPDHPCLLQSYIWQEYDLFPNFPSLKRFLAFRERKLDGALHSVMVAHSRLIKPAELRAVDGVFSLH